MASDVDVIETLEKIASTGYMGDMVRIWKSIEKAKADKAIRKEMLEALENIASYTDETEDGDLFGISDIIAKATGKTPE